jgi:hypothetical protein
VRRIHSQTGRQDSPREEGSSAPLVARGNSSSDFELATHPEPTTTLFALPTRHITTVQDNSYNYAPTTRHCSIVATHHRLERHTRARDPTYQETTKQIPAPGSERTRRQRDTIYSNVFTLRLRLSRPTASRLFASRWTHIHPPKHSVADRTFLSTTKPARVAIQIFPHGYR